MVGKSHDCPVLRPSRKEFLAPFTEYISNYFKENPDVPVIKVVPPQGYRPRHTEYPTDLRIDTPIQQNVLNHTNRAGFYDCVLLSKPSLTVEEFRRVAEERGEPKPSGDADELHERKFWKALGVNPPLYGADTPQSLFDEELEFGWNLRKLGCLLHKHDVPDIPGVTTPMTYFGMWRVSQAEQKGVRNRGTTWSQAYPPDYKVGHGASDRLSVTTAMAYFGLLRVFLTQGLHKSFFSWHVEDVDLLSINYLHYGAAKVWYAIPPGEPRKRFERMAQGLFPDAARNCPNFLRHKTVMITTTLLHDNNIPYVTVKHNPGEFVVLNAGAYHAGFNQGFNCAEAVNFATEDWIPLGKKATRCCCKALGKDAVRVDMSMFPGGQDSSSEDDNSLADGDEQMEVEDSDEGSSNAPERKRGFRKGAAAHKHSSRGEPAVAKRGPGRPRKHPLPKPLSKGSLKVRAAALKVKTAARPVTKAGRRAGGKTLASSDEARQRRQLAGPSSKQQGRVQADTAPVNPKKRRGVQHAEADDAPAAKKARKAAMETATRKVGRPRINVQALGHSTSMPAASAGLAADDVQHGGEPFLIVGRNDATGVRFFYLVQQLRQPAKVEGEVKVRWLEQLSDGLYHPSTKEWDESEGALSKVRTQKCWAKKDNHLCYKLLTLRSKIEAVELED